MISETEYQDALKIVQQYSIEKSERLATEEEQRMIAQKKREDECDEHYYVEGPKWTSYSQCTFCGKKI